MAPRVDRTVARVIPARWSSPAPVRKDRAGDRYATWQEHRTHSTHPSPEFLSLFKGQGAAARGDDRVASVRSARPRRAFSSAG